MDAARSEPLPSVSVIVPCFNAAGGAARLVAALREQDHPAELILVDDGSTDGTAVALRALTENLPQARVLVHDQNLGRAAARNTGIREAAGDVLLFLDADMAPAQDCVRVHAEAHLQPGLVGLVSTPVLEGLDPGEPYHGYLAARQRAARGRTEEPIPFRYFIIGYTSVKAGAVRELGGFDERFSYGEDIDFAYRLSQRYGDALFRSERARVRHYNHGTLDDRLSKLREFGRHNLPVLLAKHPGIARAANLNFVEPSGSVTGRLKYALLRPRLARVVHDHIHRIPKSIRFVGVRYLMAATIAHAFNNARSH